MILKSEKRFYDDKEKKYKQPLCEFDTENLIVAQEHPHRTALLAFIFGVIFHICWSEILTSFRN